MLLDGKHWSKIGKGFIGLGDCRKLLLDFPDNSIDAVLTDPPYNYEFVGMDWNHEEILRRMNRVSDSNSSTLIKHLPYGSGLAGGKRNARWYAKNRQNALDYGKWIESWASELYRVCKPGSFVGVFNATRFLAHTQVALENVGFYSRDVLVMKKNSGIPKGFNGKAMLKKMGRQDAEEWQGFHSALRNEWEGVVLVQKPLTDNYQTTLAEFNVGLMKAEKDDGGFKSNIFDLPLTRSSKGDSDTTLHATPKPQVWIDELIELLMPPSKDAVILDPFLGTGTLGISAEKLGRKWIGIDLVPEYVELSKKRISKFVK